MKKAPCLSLFTFIFFAHSYGQITRLEDLKNKILISLKTERFDSFQQLLLDTSDCREFFSGFDENDNMRNVALPQFKSFLSSDSSKLFYKQVFAKLVDKGKHYQIDWDKIHDVKLVIQDSASSPGKLFSIGNIIFTYKDSSYMIFYIMITRLSSGFKILNIFDIGNYNSIMRDILIDDAKERNKKTSINI